MVDKRCSTEFMNALRKILFNMEIFSLENKFILYTFVHDNNHYGKN